MTLQNIKARSVSEYLPKTQNKLSTPTAFLWQNQRWQKSEILGVSWCLWSTVMRHLSNTNAHSAQHNSNKDYKY